VRKESLQSGQDGKQSSPKVLPRQAALAFSALAFNPSLSDALTLMPGVLSRGRHLDAPATFNRTPAQTAFRMLHSARHSQLQMSARLPKRGTSEQLLAALSTKVLNELEIDPELWDAEMVPRTHPHRMGVEMVAALREELLLTPRFKRRREFQPKKHLCIFDFDGTLTEEYTGVPREFGELGSPQRIMDLRDFLEKLHEDAHLVVCSRNSQDYIAAVLQAENLLDLFDIVVDRNHMIHLGMNKGRALNELLLPLFPSVGGAENVLFVDDDSRNIREIVVAAPACQTFMCDKYPGLTKADMQLLLDAEVPGTAATAKRDPATAAPAQGGASDGDTSQVSASYIPSDGTAEGNSQRRLNAREGLKNAIRSRNAADLKRAEQIGRLVGFTDMSDLGLMSLAENVLKDRVGAKRCEEVLAMPKFQ